MKMFSAIEKVLGELGDPMVDTVDAIAAESFTRGNRGGVPSTRMRPGVRRVHTR